MKLLNKIMWVLAAEADSASGETTNGNGGFWSNLVTMLPWIIIIVAFLVVMVVMNKRSNAKRQKEVDELRNSIHVGDTIKTIGGIIGTIVAVNVVDGEQQIVFETGLEDSKHTMVIDSQAVYQNLTYMKKKAEIEAQRKAEQEKNKAQRGKLKEAKEEEKVSEKAEEPSDETSNENENK